MTDESKDLDKWKREAEIDFDVSEDTRDKCNEEMRFISVPGGMWEGFLEKTHGAHGENKGRAKLELDITSEIVNRYVGEQRLNRANGIFKANDDATSESDAELLNGVYRADFVDNDGRASIDQAVYEQAVCGVGAYKITTKFEDEEDPENQKQNIHFEPTYNAFNHVIWDSNAKRLDKADAKRCTLLTTHTHDAFKEAWPDADPVSAMTPTNRTHLNWSTPELIYIAERYTVRKEKVKVHVYENMESGKVESYRADDIKLIADELKADGWEFVRERVLNIRQVYKVIFNGNEILEKEKRIPGKWIPIIPMYGYRTYVDGVEFVKGLVRPMMDANRSFNTNVSRLMESSAASGDSMPIFTEKQVEGKMDLLANRTDKNFMVINDLEDGAGNSVPAGPVGNLPPNQVDPNAIAATQIIDGYVQRQTGSTPQDQVNPDASGKAIKELRKRENLGTAILSDNAKTSIKHGTMVYQAIAAEIYTDTRDKRSIGPDGKDSVQRLNKMVMDEETGQFIQANVLSKGKFSVLIEVGNEYESQKEASIESIERIIGIVAETAPEYIPVLIGSWITTGVDGPGTEALKKFNRNKMLTSGLVEPETPEEEQMLQQLGQQSDPQADLAAAATKQQEAEAMNLVASAGNKDADTMKKKAETAKIIDEVGQARVQKALERLSNTG